MPETSYAARLLNAAERSEEAARAHAARGATDAAIRAAARAQEARDLADLAKVAEERIGSYAGPSSASMVPPAMGAR